MTRSWAALPDGGKVWLPDTCVAQLVNAGIAVRQLPWPTIDAMPTSPTPSCDAVQVMSAPDGSVLAAPSDKGFASDAWITAPDGTKQWQRASCVFQLVAAGAPYRVVPWSQLSAMPDMASAPCEQVLPPAPTTPQSSPAAVAEVAPVLTLTQDKQPPGNDGFVRYPDGSSQWVSASCRAQLESVGILSETVSWEQISIAAAASPARSCSDVATAATVAAAAPQVLASALTTEPDTRSSVALSSTSEQGTLNVPTDSREGLLLDPAGDSPAVQNVPGARVWASAVATGSAPGLRTRTSR